MASKVNHSSTFHLKCGKKFKDLKGLVKNLKNMSQEVFVHHVNDKKNDFSMWMTHSLKEEKLGKKIKEKIDKIEIELEVLRHIVDNGIILKVPKKKKTPAKKKAVSEKKKSQVKMKKKKVVKKTKK